MFYYNGDLDNLLYADEFDNYLDSQYGMVNLAGNTYSTSYILRYFDSDEYYKRYCAYVDNRQIITC